jgi:hypothetical protein
MTEGRDQERRPVGLPGNLKTPRSRQDVTVSNLSTIGCKVEAIYLSLIAGEHVLIRPEGLQSLPAKVVWCSGPSAGLLFDQPLHPAVLDNLCRQHPHAKEAMAAKPCH